MKNLNYWTLLILAPILILTGILSFLVPSGLMSNAPCYNIFHLVFGTIGLSSVFSQRQNLIRGFNLGFGLIDLYQALASFMLWFPESYFQWKTGDDILHILIGGALVLIGGLENKMKS